MSNVFDLIDGIAEWKAAQIGLDQGYITGVFIDRTELARRAKEAETKIEHAILRIAMKQPL